MAMRETKFLRKAKASVDMSKVYDITEAVDVIKNFSRDSFDESVDISVRLGVNTRKSDQVVRGSVVLPCGTGKTVRVYVFCEANQVEEAKQAGADRAGLEDLIASVQKGELDFDISIATPDTMQAVSKLGPVLGPRGLMPNLKLGTVTKDVATAVKNAKSGQVGYKTDRAGIVHCSIGRASFKTADLVENLGSLLKALTRSKPASAKGVYLQKLTVSTTMGFGLTVDLSTVGVR